MFFCQNKKVSRFQVLTTFDALFYLFLISILKLTTQAVHIYTNKIAMLLKIVTTLINVNWKIIKTMN